MPKVENSLIQSVFLLAFLWKRQAMGLNVPVNEHGLRREMPDSAVGKEV
ncbi:MAG: hypothetical protein LIP00_09610 [Parabacteroides sp.]|nr:hypothetical protein [Parabacteroides sp.]